MENNENLAMSINYFDEGTIKVSTLRTEFKSLDDAFDLMADFLETLGYTKDEALDQMFTYASHKVSGEIRQELVDLLKDVEKEVGIDNM